MRKLATAIVSLLLLSTLLISHSAEAQCTGTGGVPFNCANGSVPGSSDLWLGGQGGHTVNFTTSQMLQGLQSLGLKANACEAWITASGTITPSGCGTVSSGTWTSPSWVTSNTLAEFDVIGGGGAGGGCATSGDLGGQAGSGAGTIYAGVGLIAASTGYNFTIGTGGTAVAANTASAGGSGSSTSITISGTTPTANGGTGGTSCSNSNLVGPAAASASNGTININGGIGFRVNAIASISGDPPLGYGTHGGAGSNQQQGGSGYGYGGYAAYSTTLGSQAGGGGVIHVRLTGN